MLCAWPVVVKVASWLLLEHAGRSLANLGIVVPRLNVHANRSTTTEHFSVDSALLRELGARLVGKPHIALAELIKNSYDADARRVRIEFTDDSIVVEDDGHGMSYDDYVNFWMRVGTTHKLDGARSPELERPFTGSKGVGRLAAQLLAGNLRVSSVALRDKSLPGQEQRYGATRGQLFERISASVDWQRAVRTGDLTSVQVDVTRDRDDQKFVAGSACGTRLELRGLKSTWGEEEFRALASEIWALRPPYEVGRDSAHSFDVELISPHGNIVNEFAAQMHAILDNWRHRISYQLADASDTDSYDFEFSPHVAKKDDDEDAVDDAGVPEVAEAPAKILTIAIENNARKSPAKTYRVLVENCLIDALQCEVRIFNLSHRQGKGVKVDDARKYMRQWGGVHIYDGGFRLPYYGPEDWLGLERDHARRQSTSALLPRDMRLARQMHHLPSARRVFGTAHVSTAHEARVLPGKGVADEHVLAIQVSRDRLTDNPAYRTLSQLVRLGLDLYADTVRRDVKAPDGFGTTPETRPSKLLVDVEAAVDAAAQKLDEDTRRSIADALAAATRASKNVEKRNDTYAQILGGLATIGMATLAWEHEAAKQRRIIMDAALRLKGVGASDAPLDRGRIAAVGESLEASANSLNDVASMFRAVLDPIDRETTRRILAKPLVEEVVRNTRVLAHRASVDTTGVAAGLRLPAATVAGWTSVLQNLLVNAYNAVLTSERREVVVDGGEDGDKRWLRIQDSADEGIDLKAAADYFEPFARGRAYDAERARLGLGGSGLGLSVVRMITEPLGVHVAFEAPEPDYASSVVLRWKEGHP